MDFQRLLQVSAANYVQAFNNANVALSPDGSCLATAWRNSPAELWDVRTGKKLRDIGDGALSACHFAEPASVATLHRKTTLARPANGAAGRVDA